VKVKQFVEGDLVWKALLPIGTKYSTFYWRKISTSRRAHSKPNEAGLTHVPNPKRASQFSWNW
jgi:hypothetical protein